MAPGYSRLKNEQELGLACRRIGRIIQFKASLAGKESALPLSLKGVRKG